MKKSLALMLVVSMIASMSVSSFAEEIDLGGDNGVKTPIYSYQIPKNMNDSFAIDAFQKDPNANGSQIFSVDFPIVNKSDVGIKAAIKANIVDGTTSTEKLVIKETSAAVSQTDVNNKKKEIYMETVAADTVAVSASTAPTTDPGNRPVLTAVPASKTVEIAGGNVTVDLATAVVTDTGDFQINILNKAGRVIGTALSKTKPAANADASAIATAFNTSTMVMVFDGKEYTLTAETASGTTVIFDGAPTTATSPVAADLSFTLTAKEGDPATVTLGAIKYPLFGNDGASPTPADVNGANTPSKAALGISADPSGKVDGAEVAFVLKAGTYIKAYTNDTESTLFSALDGTPAKNASSFRFMGAVNPSADWQPGDVKIKAVFDVTGVSANAYKGVTFVTDGGQNSIKGAEAPSKTPTVTGPTENYTTGDLVLKYDFGTDAVATDITSITLNGLATQSDFNVTAFFVNDKAAKTLTMSAANAGSYVGVGPNVIKVTFNDTATPTVVTLTVNK